MTTDLDDLFTDAVRTEDGLRAIYGPPTGLAAQKEIDSLDEMVRRFVACASLVFVATADPDGRCDVTPRGGPPGFVTVLDEHTLAIPDATGNRRIDSLRNVVATGHAGLIFLIPGRGQTLRVNGQACISTRPTLLDRLTPVGKPPKSALVVQAEEVFTHCPKAFVRSAAWNPQRWLPADAQPSPAEIVHAHVADPALTIDDIRRDLEESLRSRLA